MNRSSKRLDNIKRQLWDRASKKEACRSEVADWMLPEPNGCVVVTSYFNDLGLLHGLDRLAKHLAKGAKDIKKEFVSWENPAGARATPRGRDLLAICNRLDAAFMKRHRNHEFNRWIMSLVVALSMWHPSHRFDLTRERIRVSTDDMECFAKVALFVQLVTRSVSFKRRIKAEQQLALQNFRSACALMISLFARYSHLLILRIDLYYQGEGRDEALSDGAQAAFNRYIRTIRRQGVVPDVLGCLSSREAGAHRGIHYHLLVVMNGHKWKDADGHTRELGDRWIKGYTPRGGGTYFNCYARRHSYSYNGLGSVRLSDWRKLVGVHLALDYMTKSDYLVKPRGGCERNFRRSLIRQEGVKMGAPRAPGHGMSTVWSVLGKAGRPYRSK